MRLPLPHRRVRRLRAVLAATVIGLVVALMSVVGGASTARAHTGFDSSSPADGEVVEQPVGSVVITFTRPVTPVGDQFVALDASGQLRSATSIESDDSATFVVSFDPPLAGGAIGVRWSVQASDGHTLEGAFAFTVNAAVTPATTTPPTTSSPATSAPATAAPSNSAEPAPTTGAPATTTTAGAGEPATEPEVTVVSAGGAGEPPAAPGTGVPVSLDEFLADSGDIPGEGRQLAGRLISLLGVALTIGGMAFLATAFRGAPTEIAGFVRIGRVTAALVAVGALIEYLGANAATGAQFFDAWRSTPASAMALRFVGAVAIVAGLRDLTVARQRSLSAAVIDDPVRTQVVETTRRWNARASAIAWVGAAMVVASYWFDGHTVTRGFRPLHALVNSVHVVAGSVWVGGVVSLAGVVWWRRGRGTDARGAELVTRFSGVATVALGAVAAAGLIMAVMVLDGFAALTGTEWGQLLLLKVAAVAIAAACGAYNHFRLRPAIEAAPDDEQVRAQLRSVLSAEAMILLFVVVVTAWLVAAVA